jgi:hypothetical protein
MAFSTEFNSRDYHFDTPPAYDPEQEAVDPTLGTDNSIGHNYMRIDKSLLPVYDPDTLVKTKPQKNDNPNNVLFFRGLSMNAQTSEHKLTAISCALLAITGVLSFVLEKWCADPTNGYTDTAVAFKIWTVVCGFVLLQTAVPKFLQWVTPAFHVANAVVVPFMQATFMYVACKRFVAGM